MKKVATLTLAALAAATATAPAMARSSYQAHLALARKVRQAGISVHINEEYCNKTNSLGLYSPSQRAILICQENRNRYNDAEVAWTEEDYDTLRHEAHHVVQDCRDSSYNGELNAVYKRPIDLGIEWLGKEGTKYVANMYARKGASEHVQVMEIEAFAVAAMNDPAEQIRDIQRYCF